MPKEKNKNIDENVNDINGNGNINDIDDGAVEEDFEESAEMLEAKKIIMMMEASPMEVEDQIEEIGIFGERLEQFYLELLKG